MENALTLLIIPFVLSLVITGIHVYFGIHVVTRGIIFVDLSIAQLAALGAAFASLMHAEAGSQYSFMSSFAMTVAGALIFSLARRLPERVPREAIIGVVFAVASAATILVLDKSPHGTEELKSLLVQDILWVQEWPKVATIALVYLAVALLHLLLRRNFSRLTFERNAESVKSVRFILWDILFFTTFGIVITFSVRLAGVLLVFSYLIIPALVAIIFADRFLPRLLIGWIIGFVVSAVGLSASLLFDLPTGATMIVSFGGSLLLAGMVKKILISKS
ncbi:MAG: metal ABC transporter permease [Deltaproteobacteria bacterium]|nr:metal ABC transporter permease [Deltaproteobacteria bacterium]